MEPIVIQVGFLDENVYIIYDDKTKEGIIIDPGDEAHKIIPALEARNINIKAILLTHGHYDHIGACAEVMEFTKAPLYAGANEVKLLEDSELNRSGIMSRRKNEIVVDKTFNDGDVFEVGSIKLKVIFTPGHTFGSVCYYDEENKNLYSGDTLFYRSVGRTDLPTGNGTELGISLNKLMQLPDDVRVYPGHDRITTIGYEKKNNPYMNMFDF